MAQEWQQIKSTEATVPGMKYRVTLAIKAPFSEFLAHRLRDAITLGNNLRNLDPFHKLREKFTITSIYWNLPMVSARTGRSEPWPFYIEFRAAKVTHEFQEAGVGDAVLVLGGLVVLIITATASVLIAGKKFERLGEKTAQSITGVTKQVLNPGFVLAGFIVAVLFLKGR